jgi:hypothetical protein
MFKNLIADKLRELCSKRIIILITIVIIIIKIKLLPFSYYKTTHIRNSCFIDIITAREN